MQQFTIPQFLDVEDRILGPLSVRQFVILLIGAIVLFITYKLFVFTWFIVIGIFISIIFGTLAFFKVNGMPFHFFILNLVQTLRKPKVRVWLKDLTTAELKILLNKKPEEKKEEKIFLKDPLRGSSLSELSLIVDTGGIYKGENENPKLAI